MKSKQRDIDQLRKRSDEIEFYNLPFPNLESVMEETPIPNNIPKLLPPTEFAHNWLKDNMSMESLGFTPNTQNVIDKPNTPPSTTLILTPTLTLELTLSSIARPPQVTTPTPKLKPTPASNTRPKRNKQLPSYLKDYHLYMHEEQDQKGEIVSLCLMICHMTMS